MANLIGRYTDRNPHGNLVLLKIDEDGEIAVDTFQCPHCGGHYLKKPMSPRDRRRFLAVGITLDSIDKRTIVEPPYCWLCGSCICNSLGCREHADAVAAGTIHTKLESPRLCIG